VFGYTFVRLVGALNAILEHFAFSRQKLSDLIKAGSAANIIHQLACLVFVAAHCALPWCFSLSVAYA
jgi:hypothetical protein